MVRAAVTATCETYLIVFYPIGGSALAWASGSVLPLVVVALAPWAVLKFRNNLERRR